MVMRQFQYTSRSSTVDDVIFWTKKNRECFHKIVAVGGPISEDQIQALGDNSSIDAINNHNDTVNGDVFVETSFYTPLENLKNKFIFQYVYTTSSFATTSTFCNTSHIVKY